VPYDSPLPDDVPTFAEQLTARRVRNVGVTANGMAGRPFGLHRGFMEFVGLLGLADASAFPEQLESWLEEHGGERFFWYGHFREPHAPYVQPPPFDALFAQKIGPLPASARRDRHLILEVNAGRRQLSAAERTQYVGFYDGGLAFADRQVGRLRAALEARGLLETTVVVVSADHGEALGEHGFLGHNSEVWEEVTHVPLIVRLPHAHLAGSRVRELVTLLDLAPTFAELFGFELVGPQVQGRSLLDVIAGAAGRRAVVSRAAGERSLYALRDARFKYVAHTSYSFERLFDLAQDPGELRDIKAEAGVRTSFYRQQLRRHIVESRTLSRRVAKDLALSPAEREQLEALGYLE
jgi:arylsulfatase A-like enzyme